jgi:hypothetical protein
VRQGGIIFAGPAAIAVMIFYYFIPFLIVAGAPDSFAELRPYVITASVLLIAFGSSIMASAAIRSSHIQADFASVFNPCGTRLDFVKGRRFKSAPATMNATCPKAVVFACLQYLLLSARRYQTSPLRLPTRAFLSTNVLRCSRL